MAASHRAVSRSMDTPADAAAVRCSTLALTSVAMRDGTLPSRRALRVPSSATNRIRRCPFGSLLMLATARSFLRSLNAAPGDVQVEQVRQRVKGGHGQPPPAAHEPAHGRLGKPQRLADRVA